MKRIDKDKIVLTVEHFNVGFKQYTKGLKRNYIETVHDITLDIHQGEILAIIGASGSGKSLLAHGIMGILPTNAQTGGRIIYEGQELNEQNIKKIRGSEIALIPQSVNYLDPMQKVGDQILPPNIKNKGIIGSLLQKFELSNKVSKIYPYELSGGMARRVLISTAIASNAKLIIADEPTPGIHKSIVEETLRTFRDFADNGGSIMMITHDIDLAFKIADRVAVFCEGRVIAIEETLNFVNSPDKLKSPYSRALWHALPQNGFYVEKRKNYSGDINDSTETLKAIDMFIGGKRDVS